MFVGRLPLARVYQAIIISTQRQYTNNVKSFPPPPFFFPGTNDVPCQPWLRHGSIPCCWPCGLSSAGRRWHRFSPNCHTSGQGALPQMVVVPVSGGMGTQPQFVQVPTSGAMTTAYQPQQFVIPPTSGHGGYTRMSNEQV